MSIQKTVFSVVLKPREGGFPKKAGNFYYEQKALADSAFHIVAAFGTGSIKKHVRLDKFILNESYQRAVAGLVVLRGRDLVLPLLRGVVVGAVDQHDLLLLRMTDEVQDGAVERLRGRTLEVLVHRQTGRTLEAVHTHHGTAELQLGEDVFRDRLL